MQPFDFLLLTLAIWLTAYALIKLSAPFNLFGKLRTWAGAGENAKAGSLGEMLTCIYCVSLTVAVIWYLVYLSPARALVYPFALAGGALFIHRHTGGFHV